MTHRKRHRSAGWMGQGRLAVFVLVCFAFFAPAGTGSALAAHAAQPAGVHARPLQGQSTITAASVPVDPARFLFRRVATGLNLPLLVANAGDGSGRLFVVDQDGKIFVIKNGSLLSTPFLNISSAVRFGGEQGLLALAFHPNYKTNGLFYVMYTAPRPSDSTGSILTLRRFHVSAANPDQADAASGTTILTIAHPVNGNHNGGTLAFGNDGFLYWSTGDGGGGGDIPNNAQNLNILLGKILRIDVDHPASPRQYSIPASNPFSGGGGLGEIWAYGLRNPFRLSFDSLTHDLFIGDVGQSLREEIDFQPASSTGGENYGWHVMEGTLCYNTADALNPLPTCDTTNKVLPIAEYDHSLGDCAVTGGYVYRGTNFPSLADWYLYGDYCGHRIYGLHNNGSGWDVLSPVTTTYWIAGFGEDENRELYVTDHTNSGSVYQIRYRELLRTPSDFDGDSTADPAKFYASTGRVWWLNSSTSTWSNVLVGTDASPYLPRSDFDGDGKTDPAKYVPSSGAVWYLRSTTGTWNGVFIGTDGTQILPGMDFEGDGKTDLTKYVASAGALWYLQSSSGTWNGVYIGSDGTPLAGSDFDGDGLTDPAKYVASAGAIWYLSSMTHTWNGVYIGSDGVPVAASDFDGDGMTDPAKFVASSNSLWYLGSKTGTWHGVYLGSGTFNYVEGCDFDGDGMTDPAVFSPSTGTLWYVKSSTGTLQGAWLGGDTFINAN